VKTEIEQKIDVNDTRKSPEGSSEHFSDAEVPVEKPEIPRGKELGEDEPVSVEIEEPETQLVKTMTYKVPAKNFGTEARAALDVNHFLQNATIKANIKATKLADVIKELVVCKYYPHRRFISLHIPCIKGNSSCDSSNGLILIRTCFCVNSILCKNGTKEVLTL